MLLNFSVSERALNLNHGTRYGVLCPARAQRADLKQASKVISATRKTQGPSSNAPTGSRSALSPNGQRFLLRSQSDQYLVLAGIEHCTLLTPPRPEPDPTRAALCLARWAACSACTRASSTERRSSSSSAASRACTLALLPWRCRSHSAGSAPSRRAEPTAAHPWSVTRLRRDPERGWKVYDERRRPGGSSPWVRGRAHTRREISTTSLTAPHQNNRY